MSKGKIIQLSIVTLLGAAITILALYMFSEGPTGTLTHDDIKSLSAENPFRFKDSGENGENTVTEVKFFTCLNKILKSLKSADNNLIRVLCCNEILEKEAEEKGNGEREAHVRNAIIEARNLMFGVSNSKETIEKILKKGNEKSGEELIEAIPSAFFEALSAEQPHKQAKGEELNTALANLFIWLWLNGSLPEDKNTQTFRKTYADNQSVQNLLKSLDEETKGVANSKISVTIENKEISMSVIEHILTSIFQASMRMGSGIPQVSLPVKMAIISAGAGLEKEKPKDINQGKGIIEFLFGSNEDKSKNETSADEAKSTTDADGAK
ncbi:hypothetical protein EROM_050110 [Encephalitozoon romaleae SJ-2008]|uniref:Uncharacterized protein n=1 Tax=Encephalitozoon romaleae (strain SJ-2008) TaxID=1178016 RepID=I7AMK4_ENCRO|nr:hypothetical protein EROM_050110 [Encephalitozoon romaleae SJ-2008]AFN82944.1 hypothetical protein EROM_050110 [Encephalitozoon romaleae SJ-2008]